MSNWGLHEGRRVDMGGLQGGEMILELNLNIPPVEESLGLPAPQRLTTMNDGNPWLQVQEDDDSDDVDVISPRKFEEARLNNQRRHGFMSNRTHRMIDADRRGFVQVLRGATEMPLWPGTAHDHATENCNLSLGLNSRQKRTGSVSRAPSERNLAFTCSICCDSMTGETSTRCGHIFCKQCILTAIDAQHKCPTCRRKLKSSELRRVYLPAATYT